MSLPALAKAAVDAAHAAHPATTSPILQLGDVSHRYRVGGRGFLRRRRWLPAVAGVSLSIEPGETLALVGESGCGKTTVGKIASGQLVPSSGTVRLDGTEIGALLPKRRSRIAQMVYQHPMDALDPRLSVLDQMVEPLRLHRRGTRRQRRDQAIATLATVGLGEELCARVPSQLSGGQAQRVVIARALIVEPQLLVLDEPLSALDVSVQAQIANLLQDVKRDGRLSYLFISHDLRLVDFLADRVAVMYFGRVVEIGPRRAVLGAPAHPYTRALIDAVPRPEPSSRRDAVTRPIELPDPLRPPPGCSYRLRCPCATDVCREVEPVLRSVEPGRAVACHLAEATRP